MQARPRASSMHVCMLPVPMLHTAPRTRLPALTQTRVPCLGSLSLPTWAPSCLLTFSAPPRCASSPPPRWTRCARRHVCMPASQLYLHPTSLACCTAAALPLPAAAQTAARVRQLLYLLGIGEFIPNRLTAPIAGVLCSKWPLSDVCAAAVSLFTFGAFCSISNHGLASHCCSVCVCMTTSIFTPLARTSLPHTASLPSATASPPPHTGPSIFITPDDYLFIARTWPSSVGSRNLVHWAQVRARGCKHARNAQPCCCKCCPT